MHPSLQKPLPEEKTDWPTSGPRKMVYLCNKCGYSEVTYCKEHWAYLKKAHRQMGCILLPNWSEKQKKVYWTRPEIADEVLPMIGPDGKTLK